MLPLFFIAPKYKNVYNEWVLKIKAGAKVMKNTVVHGADILLPAEGISPEKWAVVAVDQYTSEPEYWREVEEFVGEAPSTLRITLPEIYLSEGEARTPEMQKNMRTYLENGILEKKVENGYILVERTTETGVRLGLMACLDLEEYDYAVGSQSMIRATEGTVLERVPPRVKIRRGAALELPHVLMLLDDAKMQAIEPAYETREKLELIYDVDLMQGGGRLRGWKLDGEAACRLEAALDAIYENCGGLFLAVGDGNHSLAAARAYWLEIREDIPEEERKNHPARYALAEIENLRSPAIRFEPIHRVVTGINPTLLMLDYENHLREEGISIRDGNELTLVSKGFEKRYGFDAHPLRDLQIFLDAWLAVHPEAEIDYIHGDDTLRRLADREDALGLMPCGFGKADLFPHIRRWGVLPRKTFSMGHAHEKRYYFEARKITE